MNMIPFVKPRPHLEETDRLPALIESRGGDVETFKLKVLGPPQHQALNLRRRFRRARDDLEAGVNAHDGRARA